MMKNQAIVVETNVDNFKKKCKEYFDRGWEVVPDTLRSSVATSSCWNKAFDGIRVSETVILTAVFEKNEK